MILQLERCRVLFPDWYDERAEYEAELKGWLPGVEIELSDGSRYGVTFYDPVRLRQDLEEEAKQDRPCLAEPGMVVVPAVTRAAVTHAAEHLATSGFFARLRSSSAEAPFVDTSPAASL